MEILEVPENIGSQWSVEDPQQFEAVADPSTGSVHVAAPPPPPPPGRPWPRSSHIPSYVSVMLKLAKTATCLIFRYSEVRALHRVTPKHRVANPELVFSCLTGTPHAMGQKTKRQKDTVSPSRGRGRLLLRRGRDQYPGAPGISRICSTCRPGLGSPCLVCLVFLLSGTPLAMVCIYYSNIRQNKTRERERYSRGRYQGEFPSPLATCLALATNKQGTADDMGPSGIR